MALDQIAGILPYINVLGCKAFVLVLGWWALRSWKEIELRDWVGWIAWVGVCVSL